MSWYLMGAIFLVGIWGIIARHNMVKKVMALSIANSAVMLLFIYQGALSGDTAPIEGGAGTMADPLPQALVLTAIVIGLGIIVFTLALKYKYFQLTGTDDLDQLKQTDKP